MDSRIDNSVIRQSFGPDLATYLRTTLADVEGHQISSHLLAAIELESVPPRVIRVFLSARADDASLLQALQNSHSILVRSSAIKELGKRLCKVRFAETWTALGGTKGLLDLMSAFSFDHVRLLCATLRRSGTRSIKQGHRQECMTELTMSLLGHPNAKFENPDRRQLDRYYRRILSACTSALVLEQGFDGIEDIKCVKHLARAHPQDCQQLLLEKIGSTGSLNDLAFEHLEPLILSDTHVELDGDRLSQGLYFNIQLLDAISRKSNGIKNTSLLGRLASALSRRIRTGHLSAAIRVRAIESIIRAYRAHDACRKPLTFYANGTLSNIIYVWSREPSAYTDALVGYLQLLSPVYKPPLWDCLDLLTMVGRGIRWPLLVLLMKHIRGVEIDIEQDSQLRVMEEAWPSGYFVILPQDSARELFRRLSSFKTVEEFLRLNVMRGKPHSIFGEIYESRSSVFEIHLSRGQPRSLDLARETVRQYQQQVSEERDAIKRANFAQMPICCAIASGSLELYKETLLWARRFNRDHETVQKLYSRGAKIMSPESVELLCGIPDSSEKGAVNTQNIATAVRKGNEIMLLLLETACMCLREPGFNESFWRAVYCLFALVTWERLRRSHRISSEDVWESVWQDTVQTLVQAEDIGLEEDNAELKFNSPMGPLEYERHTSRVYLDLDLNTTALSFFDKLAQERAQLWQRHRQYQHPEIVTLPFPWPRGLPLQCLSEFTRYLKGYCEGLPYLMSRAKAIVFAEPSNISGSPPDAGEVRAAIDDFVEGYSSALRFYINAFATEDERHAANKNAWDYAVSILSSDRMSSSEAARFWHEVWQSALIPPPKLMHDELYHALATPRTRDPSKPTEWNPEPEHRARSGTKKQLKVTCLDCMLDRRLNSLPGQGFTRRPFNFDNSAACVPPLKSVFSDDDDLQSTPSKEGESLIVTALLHTNDKYASDAQLLSTPFPSIMDARFPALFLDDEFLERKDLTPELARVVLERFRDQLPTSLVMNLSMKLFQNLEEGASVNIFNRLRAMFFRLVDSLAKGDKPDAVLKLVRTLVAHRPEYSAYHRRLISNSFFKRLSPNQVKDLLSALADDIRTILRENIEKRSEKRSDTRPFVKVTTVKMLAQIFSDPVFVDPATAVDFLVGLLTQSNHVDIINATMESLGAILKSTKDENAKDKIFRALEISAVPTAASLHECRVLSDDDWDLAEANLDLPDIGDSMSCIGELLELATTTPPLISREVERRLLLPTLFLSAQYNTWWTRIFLKKYGLPSLDNLPEIPARLRLLEHFFESRNGVPSDIFRMWTEHVILNLNPSSDLSAAVDFVLKSPDLRSSNAGEHFLYLWNRSDKDAVWIIAADMRECLYMPSRSTQPDQISCDEMSTTFLKIAKALIKQDRPRMILQKILFGRLAPPFNAKNKNPNDLMTLEDEDGSLLDSNPTFSLSEDELWVLWRKNVRPLLMQILEHIESLRTPEWQQNPFRKPRTLYQTYGLRLWLLDYPLPRSQADQNGKVGLFAEQIKAECKALAAEFGKPYHQRLEQLKDAALKVAEEDYCGLACQLGSFSDPDEDQTSLATHLRVEIADALLHAADKAMSVKVDDVTRVPTTVLLQSWMESADEEIRMRAAQSSQKLDLP